MATGKGELDSIRDKERDSKKSSRSPGERRTKLGETRAEKRLRLEQQQADGKCGAITRTPDKKGKLCGRPAGWGTNHPGVGRCKLHGGCSTGPKNKEKLKGNNNGVSTGEFEAIWMDQLGEEEIELFRGIKTEKEIQIDNEIRLLDIRMRRMLERIAKLADLEMTVVKSIYEQGYNSLGAVDVIQTVEHATLGQIMGIEEALTRVQEDKRKLIELKHKVETAGDDPNKDNLWVVALQEVAFRRSRKNRGEEY